MERECEAFIFDLDGVITDTAEYHYLAWKQLAEDLDIHFDRDFNEKLKGVSRMDSLNRILELDPSIDISYEEKETLATRKNEHYIKLIENMSEGDILPGIVTLLEEIKSAQLKLGLGSASKNAVTVLEKLGLINYFDYIVDASKVERGKPHPETFLKAAEGLQVAPENCIGVEDAKAGIEAIKAAQMFAVGVGPKETLSDGDYVVDTTDQLTFAQMIKKFNAK